MKPAIKAAIVLSLLALTILAINMYSATVKAIKTTRVNDWQVIVSCTNHGTPTVHNVSGSLVVSCEGRVE